MSRKTDKLAAAAKAAEDKLAAAKVAEAADALVSPADKAFERGFARGVLPEADRRAPDAIPGLPAAHVVDGVVVELETPPTGVRSPATREIDLNVPFTDSTPGTPIPPLVPAPERESERVARSVAAVRVNVAPPTIPASVETRGPLVPLIPLSEVHPSTIEAAIEKQQIPNDQIHGVFEDADGVKRDALGHPFTEPKTPHRAPAKTRGIGFDE